MSDPGKVSLYDIDKVAKGPSPGHMVTAHAVHVEPSGAVHFKLDQSERDRKICDLTQGQGVSLNTKTGEAKLFNPTPNPRTRAGLKAAGSANDPDIMVIGRAKPGVKYNFEHRNPVDDAACKAKALELAKEAIDFSVPSSKLPKANTAVQTGKLKQEWAKHSGSEMAAPSPFG